MLTYQTWMLEEINMAHEEPYKKAFRQAEAKIQRLKLDRYSKSDRARVLMLIGGVYGIHACTTFASTTGRAAQSGLARDPAS